MSNAVAKKTSKNVKLSWEALADTSNQWEIKNNSNQEITVNLTLSDASKVLTSLQEITLKANESKPVDFSALKISEYLSKPNLELNDESSEETLLRYFNPTEADRYTETLFSYYDALQIAQYMKPEINNRAEILKILSHYVGQKSLPEGKLYDLYKENTFIKNALFKNFAANKVLVAQSAASTMGSLSKSSAGLLSGLGGLNATIYADGLAKFIVKRFKQDMNEMFFRNMKDDMSKNVELTILFPKTYKELLFIDKEIYDFDRYLLGLRGLMEEDLKQIFQNANTLLENEKYKQKFQGNPVLSAFLGTIFQVIHGLIQHENAGTIIENLAFSNDYEKTEDGKNIKAGMQTIRLFSMGLRSKDLEKVAKDEKDPKYWIHGNDHVEKLFEGDALASKIWLGLMYQLAVDAEGKDIQFANETLKSKLNKIHHSNDIYQAQDYIKALYKKALLIQDNYVSYKNNKENKDGKENWQNFAAYYESVVDLIDYAPKIIEIFDDKANMNQNWYQGIYIAKGLATLKAEVEGRQYHAAIHHLADLFKALDIRPKYANDTTLIGSMKLFSDKNCTIPIREFVPIDQLKGKFFSVGTSIIDAKIKTNDGKLSKPNEEYGWLSKLIKYGTFAASMALAQNSDEVAAILDATTLPPGSARSKAKGVSIMVNSYFSGLYGRYSNQNYLTKNGFLLSAPIGFSLNFGLEKIYRSKWLPNNFQLFGSIFDVGTLANYRIDGNTTQVPKFTLGNIYAPGGFIQLSGLLNSPLGINFGYQRAPNLLLIGGVATPQPKTNRFSMGLTWDIPMWRIKHCRK